MKKFKLHFLNILSHFDNDFLSLVKSETEQALTNVDNIMPLEPLDIVFLNSPKMTIPAYGIGGMSDDINVMNIYFDMEKENLINIVKDQLKRTLAHECHHCIRRKHIGYGETLGDYMITEGLADHFDTQVYNSEPQPWSQAIEGNELDQWLVKAYQASSSTDFDYYDWFLGGSDNTPMWTGYTLGNYIVSDYLKRHPEETPASLVSIKSTIILEDFKNHSERQN